MRGSYSVKHLIFRDVNVREEIWRGYACARTGAPQSFHVRGLNDNPNTQIGRVLQLASTAIPFPHLLLGLRVCPLGELKIPAHDKPGLSQRATFLASGTTGSGTQCSPRRPSDSPHLLVQSHLLVSPHQRHRLEFG